MLRGEDCERMSSIFLLPRHALLTGFSRLFGASIGLLMVTKVKWYINSRGNEKKVFAFINFIYLEYYTNVLLKPKCVYTVCIYIIWRNFLTLRQLKANIKL